MPSRPSFRPYLLQTVILLLLGWGGLFLIVFYTEPTVWPRWGFFAFWSIGLTALALPVHYFLSVRFPSENPLPPQTLVRQSLWAGIYGATLAWLQLARLNSIYTVLGLLGGFYAIEYLIGLRERAQWHAPDIDDD